MWGHHPTKIPRSREAWVKPVLDIRIPRLCPSSGANNYTAWLSEPKTSGAFGKVFLQIPLERGLRSKMIGPPIFFVKIDDLCQELGPVFKFDFKTITSANVNHAIICEGKNFYEKNVL